MAKERVVIKDNLDIKKKNIKTKKQTFYFSTYLYLFSTLLLSIQTTPSSSIVVLFSTSGTFFFVFHLVNILCNTNCFINSSWHEGMQNAVWYLCKSSKMIHKY